MSRSLSAGFLVRGATGMAGSLCWTAPRTRGICYCGSVRRCPRWRAIWRNQTGETCPSDSSSSNPSRYFSLQISTAGSRPKSKWRFTILYRKTQVKVPIANIAKNSFTLSLMLVTFECLPIDLFSENNQNNKKVFPLLLSLPEAVSSVWNHLQEIRRVQVWTTIRM